MIKNQNVGVINMDYFCAKDNCETDLSKGCRHPNDYCTHRKSCIIHFMEQEAKREGKHNLPDDINKDEP